MFRKILISLLIIAAPNMVLAKKFSELGIGAFFAEIISVLLQFAAVVALIGLIIGGYKYIASSGDPEAIATGKQAVTYSVIGIIIIILAVVATKFLMEQIGVTNLSFFGINF